MKGYLQLRYCPNILLKTQFWPLINQVITPLCSSHSSHLIFKTSLSMLLHNPLCFAASKSLFCLIRRCSSSSSSSFFFFFFFFFSSVYFFLNFIYIYIWSEKTTRYHWFATKNWSDTKNHQVSLEILKYLLKNFQICARFICSCYLHDLVVLFWVLKIFVSTCSVFFSFSFAGIYSVFTCSVYFHVQVIF